MVNDKSDFKKHFIATFCATWCANNYADACMRGKHSMLNEPPIEDAELIAEEVWKYALETGVNL